MKNPNEHLVLNHKCLPTEPPILWSVIAWMAADFYQISSVAAFGLSIFIGLKWLYFFAGVVLDKPFDIFESFRFTDKTPKDT